LRKNAKSRTTVLSSHHGFINNPTDPDPSQTLSNQNNAVSLNHPSVNDKEQINPDFKYKKLAANPRSMLTVRDFF